MKFKEGMYLLTVSFLLRTIKHGKDSWMYIYLNGEELMEYGASTPSPLLAPALHH